MRYEKIHHLQAERVEVVRQWLLPDGFNEGLAYPLSDDPGPPVSEPGTVRTLVSGGRQGPPLDKSTQALGDPR